MDEITITLPLPAKELHPNARVHHMVKAKATKAARFHAMCGGLAARERMTTAFRFWGVPLPPWLRAQTEATFYFPTARTRDADGAASSLKAYWDGIADAGVVANDSGLTHLPPRLEVDRANPRVVLTLRPIP